MSFVVGSSGWLRWFGRRPLRGGGPRALPRCLGVRSGAGCVCSGAGFCPFVCWFCPRLLRVCALFFVSCLFLLSGPRPCLPLVLLLRGGPRVWCLSLRVRFLSCAGLRLVRGFCFFVLCRRLLPLPLSWGLRACLSRFCVGWLLPLPLGCAVPALLFLPSCPPSFSVCPAFAVRSPAAAVVVLLPLCAVVSLSLVAGLPLLSFAGLGLLPSLPAPARWWLLLFPPPVPCGCPSLVGLAPLPVCRGFVGRPVVPVRGRLWRWWWVPVVRLCCFFRWGLSRPPGVSVRWGLVGGFFRVVRSWRRLLYLLGPV